MGAFPTVLLAILLIFAAGLIKLVIALILLVLAAQGIRNVRSVLQKGAFLPLSNTAMQARLCTALCAAQTSTTSKLLQSTIAGVPTRPLSYTCYLNKADAARQLIAHGADVNQDAGLNSPTPLMYA